MYNPHTYCNSSEDAVLSFKVISWLFLFELLGTRDPSTCTRPSSHVFTQCCRFSCTGHQATVLCRGELCRLRSTNASGAWTKLWCLRWFYSLFWSTFTLHGFVLQRSFKRRATARGNSTGWHGVAVWNRPTLVLHVPSRVEREQQEKQL